LNRSDPEIREIIAHPLTAAEVPMPESLNDMKTFFTLVVAGAVSLCSVQAKDEDKSLKEKSAEAWDKTKETTKEVGRAVAEKTKEAVAAVEDAVSKPDADARKVAVKLNDEGIRMSKTLEAGKTAFTVTNVGKEKHNFEIKGTNLEKSFWLSVAPNDTKIMQVDLKPGTYEVDCPLKEHAGKESTLKVTVNK
jgi:iron uptake system EfeUOB component EfeO/EfeM